MHSSFISPLVGAAYVGPTRVYKTYVTRRSRISVYHGPLCAVLLYADRIHASRRWKFSVIQAKVQTGPGGVSVDNVDSPYFTREMHASRPLLRHRCPPENFTIYTENIYTSSDKIFTDNIKRKEVYARAFTFGVFFL